MKQTRIQVLVKGVPEKFSRDFADAAKRRGVSKASQYWAGVQGLFHSSIFAGSFKSQLIEYFRGCIVSWEKVEGSIWQFYDN